jgi:hypothetical protein
MYSKKGQGLSLNVIIIAALALIVLVVLIVIFTSRTADFDQQVGKESRTELIKMRISYGECRPTVEQEGAFATEFAGATSEVEQEAARANFKSEISSCKSSINQDSCEATGCAWK